MARAGRGEREENYEPRLQNPPLPQVAGAQHFFFGDDEPPAAGGSQPDRPLSAVSGPQERDERRTVEEMSDSAPIVPILAAPVPRLGCGEVRSVLSPSDVSKQAAGLHRDHVRQQQARRRTAMEVFRAYSGPRGTRCSHAERVTLHGHAHA